MRGPPDPETRRGAGQGTPKSQSILEPHQATEAPAARQARALHRLLSFAFAVGSPR